MLDPQVVGGSPEQRLRLSFLVLLWRHTSSVVGGSLAAVCRSRKVSDGQSKHGQPVFYNGIAVGFVMESNGLVTALGLL